MATTQGVNPPEPFSFKPEEWSKWIRRFERFRLASGLDKKADAAQLNMLIYTMGDRADDILHSFKYAEGERESYKTVKEKFESHFIPKRNVIFERAMFNSRIQGPEEPVDHFVTALYSLAEHCDYGDLKDEMIRDRIVVGIRDAQLSEKLQLDRQLTLEKAITQVRQQEAVKHQQTALRGSMDGSLAAVQKDKQPLSRKGKQPTRNKRSSQPPHINRETTRCPWCGKPKHDRQHCPAKEAVCRKCKKRGHYQKVCRSVAQVASVQESGTEAFLGAVTNNSDDQWNITLQLNSKPVKFCIDTGADVTAIPEQVWKDLGKPSLVPPDRDLKSPDTHSLLVKGMLTAKLETQTHQTVLPIYVVRELTKPLLGLPAIEQLNLVRRIAAITEGVLEPITQFPKLFTGLGKLEGDYTIKLDPKAKPFALTTPRRVAVPLLKAVKEELQRMETLGVIAKIQEPTDWCAGMVVVPKADGRVRICVDLTKLNHSVCRERHPLPAVEQVLAQLSGAKVLTKLDANSGFWQIPLSPESAKLTTFITPYGRFCFHRLPFGISSAPEHFQRRMSEILTGLSGVVCMMDDILVFGSTREEHDTHLRRVLERLQNAGMTLNTNKCCFAQTSLRFLGHVIDSTGIRPDPAKLKAIKEVQTPTNVGEVRRYLGMINHLSKFAPNLAEVTKPLRELLIKGNLWVWDEPQQKAFEKTKEMLTRSPILTLFDPNLETVVSADASSFGLGAVLLQRNQGELKPVAYISRSLTQAEQKYAQIEKEALAFTWACERLSDYLIGLKFHIWTDHKPLVPLFSTKHLEQIPIRVQRFRLRMMRFQFTISHVPGKQLVIADTLSRSPSENSTDTDELLHQETNAFIKAVMQTLPATDKRMEQIKECQLNDETCQLVSSYCSSSWPDRKSAPALVKPYLSLAAEFSVVDGILMRGSRIVIPQSLQKEMLDKLHTGHQGITKCRNRARQSVWWPGLSTQLEELVNNCETCCKHQHQRAQPMTPSELPELPWQKVATDLFEWNNDNYVLVTDYYSRYIEVAKLNRSTAGEVILRLKSIFARHGLPEVVVSDNGPQYSSELFEQFAEDYQFEHITSSPYFPQANGEAERAVRTVKDMLRKFHDPHLALLTYRATPIQGGKYSPAELLMGRVLRTTVPTTRKLRAPRTPPLDEVRSRDEMTKERQRRNFDNHHGARELPKVGPGDRVWIPEKETEAIVQEEVTPRSLLVTTDQGSELRRNRQDMIKLPQSSEKGTITRTVEGKSHTLKVPEPDSSQTPSSQMSRQNKPAPERTEPRRSKRVPVPTNYYAPYMKH